LPGWAISGKVASRSTMSLRLVSPVWKSTPLVLDRVALHEAVGQARGVGHQVAKGDLALGRHAVDLAAAAAGIDPRIGEGRDELGDRVVELKAAFLVEHHDRRRGERLGHGVDAEDGVGPHRLVALEVGLAGDLGEGELAAAHHDRHHAGKTAAVDPLVHPLAHAVEPLSGKSDLFGGDERQRVHGDPPWRTARLAQDIVARHDRNGREQWQDCAKDGWRS
jgi:hypothetical protein